MSLPFSLTLYLFTIFVLFCFRFCVSSASFFFSHSKGETPRTELGSEIGTGVERGSSSSTTGREEGDCGVKKIKKNKNRERGRGVMGQKHAR